MSPTRTTLLAATLLAGVAGIAAAQTTPSAPTPSTYDPAQLPEVKGKVAQYTLTPRGDVDGLILADGTEVHLPPHLSTELVFAVRPGDAVTIHGLKARSTPMVAGVSVTNDATGTTVTAMGGRGHGERATPMEAEGKVKALLHEPRGEVNGVLLDTGTMIRLPPPEAKRLEAELVVGQPLFVRGDGLVSPLGKVVMARQIGADRTKLSDIAAPRPPHGGMMMHGPGMMHGHDHGEPPRP